MTEQQNTRPSASREIAVKTFDWSDISNPDGKTSHYTHVTAETPLGQVIIEWKGWKDNDSPICNLPWPDGFVCGDDLDHCKQLVQEAFQGIVDALADTAPGNTDPIAKYDDELRKVQGRVQPDWEGFGRAITEDWPTGDIDGSDLFDMSLKYGLIAEIPGGYNPDEHIDSEGICPERGDPWYEYTFRSAPTEHPTEQPSVRDAARVLLDYLPNYAMENAALESRARDDEGEFASLSDLLDFSGQNKAYTVVREALAAALRSLAQEGE